MGYIEIDDNCMRAVWARHDIVNCVCVVKNSLYLFEEGERALMERALGNISGAFFCLKHNNRVSAGAFFDSFKRGLEGDAQILGVCLKTERDLNKKFIFGFMRESITKTIELMAA